MVHFWMRGETKPHERRTPLTPGDAKALIAAGNTVTVERWPQRCFPDAAYEEAGCALAPYREWEKPGAVPSDAVVLGLKELPGSGGDPVGETGEQTPLPHKHVSFAHCYKNQDGWRDVLARFVKGGGSLFDLEFLTDDKGRRKVAFGRSAGFCGMGLGILAWAHQAANPGSAEMSAASLPEGLFFPSRDAFVRSCKEAIAAAGRTPKVMIMGALGRCGSGATEMATLAGAAEGIVRWDIMDPASQGRIKEGGPFGEILEADIFVNCIYLDPQTKAPPFFTLPCLEKKRNLGVMVDVSCDPNNPANPVPVYKECTSFDRPVIRVLGGAQPFDVVAIDHLPSLVPSESSAEFSAGLVTLLQDWNADSEGVWQRALELFRRKCSEAGL
eukprot:TRINITY_DN3269_c0_g1_i1.p1 TRINITY_DN3269_c0_g1~~TRINITY_DN3269_c0_g1_i1.p1  ORF type:complete len:411 (+),score=116.92 TRINITY_DN3269_c0_g1_i1:80-1234(+)